MLTTTPVLALFDPQYDTTLSADASSYGLGAVLLQRQPGGQLKPVAYISRSMTATERFSDYLIGLKFHIHTDHKPLVPLFSTKRLDELPLRVQRFRLRMLRYHFTISHIPGKDLVIADMLSRAPTSTSNTILATRNELASLAHSFFTYLKHQLMHINSTPQLHIS